MKNLVTRIQERYSLRGIQPSQELLSYAVACDKHAEDELSVDVLQDEMCKYLDVSSLRFRCLSEALGRIKEPSVSEIVTESVTMFVDSVVRTPRLRPKNLVVLSEKNVRLPSGESRKPDVSIWDGEKMKVVIECKTCLGRRRKEWMEDFQKRIQEFSTLGVNDSSMLLFVGTDNTWKGFPPGDARIRRTWFSLCPVGTWYGGGKAGEVPLINKQHQGTLSTLKNVIFTLV